ncbi:trafficking protein particle complex subunit 6A, putative [Plasmodium gallinaceum]|uniref:Trafficking protein particle complex subunit 6A, putative n=1 Tax=Plasmodium gallinaceum TaxID=5849 RepID=A0A1J1GNC5_PLAGA|nr:trafficking protein particle complex subunit 6A, putative [Plasmodium gallinaceum]CRG93765.1 trafficking protein particle complex subunit 6A, putative [Plasmodium gallinaceum]
MCDGKISKSSLLLLINEIIKTNIELLKNNEIELSSLSSNDVEDINEKRLTYEEEEQEQEEQEQQQDQEKEKEKKKKYIYNNMYEGNDKINNVKYLENDEKNYINILSSKLKDMGKNIGMKLVERMLIHKNEFNDIKDILKFIGKDIWYILFNKNADKLQTYKKGVYVVTDNDISIYLKYLLIDNGTNKKNNFIHYFLMIIIGIIKGILKRFKIKGYVTYDLNYPHCSFQINIIDD